MSSKSKKVWDALFLPKIGDKVKILRIYHEERLRNVPWLTKFIGRKGTIYRIDKGKFIGKEVQSYYILFRISPREEWVFAREEWVFEREDFEVIQ